MQRLVNYFLKGLLVFVPAALTVFAIVFVFTKLDSLFGLPIPGAGLIITLAVITFVGFLASNYIGAKFFDLIERILTRLPLVKMLYSAAKDFTEAFAGEKKGFDKPVAVELVEGGPTAIGFITREDLDFLEMPGKVAVYFPQSYNFAGSVLIFDTERVRRLDMDSPDIMTFVVSGGVSGNHNKIEKPENLK
ncbi:MAG: DUF502 domain-containing protein [Sedimentisphaeraceae bacterium JB056]